MKQEATPVSSQRVGQLRQDGLGSCAQFGRKHDHEIALSFGDRLSQRLNLASLDAEFAGGEIVIGVAGKRQHQRFFSSWSHVNELCRLFDQSDWGAVDYDQFRATVADSLANLLPMQRLQFLRFTANQ